MRIGASFIMSCVAVARPRVTPDSLTTRCYEALALHHGGVDLLVEVLQRAVNINNNINTVISVVCE